jgi:lipid A 3-O-deacylase
VGKHSQGLALALLLGLGLLRPAAADDVGRFTAIEENDLFAPANHDQHYTQGARIGYFSGNVVPQGQLASPHLWGLFEGGSGISRHWEVTVEQDIFTPRDKTRTNPDPRDRPYAGWLHLGFGFIQDSRQEHLDHLGFELGVIGPSSQAAQAQNRFHLAIDIATAQGWGFQLHDEIAGTIDYERHWRLFYQPVGDLAFDFLPEAGLTVGNVYDYAEIGGRIRFGRNLLADYGPSRIGPGPSGTAYYNPDNIAEGLPIVAYGFLGTQGRIVGRNIFLDGNSFQASRSVSKNLWVGDLEAGFVLGWQDWLRVSYSWLLRSQEFKHQAGPDHFGSLMLSLILPL